ncbi:MAG: ABC transporter ATP-binding protein [Dehalococcoidales bacterium]
MITLEGLTKSYKMGKENLVVLKGLNLQVNKGELVAIMGASGSGKTTLLNIVGCLDRPTTGKYYFEDKEVSRLKSSDLARIRGQKIGFIFQTFNLLSRISALGNVELGMTYAGGVNRQRAIEALTKVGLGKRIHHLPLELSGGEQQRVAIARAIVKDPSLFLADEPTGQLDSKSGEEVISILLSLNAEQGTTLVMVTHDASIAHRCKRIIHLKDGEIIGEENI